MDTWTTSRLARQGLRHPVLFVNRQILPGHPAVFAKTAIFAD
jgi:hypothetical protein